MSTTEPAAWPDWVETWVMPYLNESGLWPVLFALLGHVVVVIAPLLAAMRRGVVVAIVPLTVLIVASGALVKMELDVRRRPGAVTFTLALLWTASIALAWIALQTGIF